MSHDYLINTPRQHLVGYTLPPQFYKDLYEKIKEAKFFFIPLIVKDKKPKIYFERQDDPKLPVVCRLFWRDSDVKLYVKKLNALGVQGGEAVGWESTPESIINSVITARTKLPGVKVEIVATVFYEDEFRDVEVFWSSNESFMV